MDPRNRAQRSPRVRAIAAVIGTVVAIGLGAGPSAHTVAAAPIDALVVDSDARDGLFQGHFYDLVGPGDGTYEVGDLFYEPGTQNGVFVLITPSNPSDGFFWHLQFGAPTGQQLVVGTYPGATMVSGQSTPFVSITNGTSCSEEGSFTVEDVAWGADHLPTRFAASFSISCGPGLPGFYGQVRVGSDQPINDRGAAASPSGLVFPAAEVDTDSATLTTTVSNIGPNAITVGSATITGTMAFAITADACSGKTLTVGAGCLVSIQATPRLQGLQFGTLLLPMNTLSGVEAVGLSVRGNATTTTTLETNKTSVVSPEYATLTATVTPNPGGGLVDFCVNGQTTGCSFEFVDAATGTATRTFNAYPGTYSIVARFRGRTDWAPSESAPVVISTATGTSLTTWSSWNPAQPDRYVSLLGLMDPISNQRPNGGTLSLRDETTGTNLAAGPVTNGVWWTTACARLAPGDHTIRVTYSGWQGYSGSTTTFVQHVAADAPAIDPTPPPENIPLASVLCGDITVADGAAISTDPTVSVDLDPDQFRGSVVATSLSNDGSTWVERPADLHQSWSLIDPAGGGTDTDGAKTVYFRWLDEQNVWSAPVARSIVLDRVAPVTSAPARSFVVGTTAGSTLPVRLAWVATDAGTGIARFELQRRTDGGTWLDVSTTLTAPSISAGLAPGHTYQFRVRGIDGIGHVGAFATGSSFHVTSIADSSPTIAYGGTWVTQRSSSDLGGTLRSATAAGASATVTVTGRSFAWVAEVGPTQGSARVYVNGVLVKTVSLSAPTTASRRIVFSTIWSRSTTRTIRIVVVGTAHHPRVDVDGFLTLT